MTETWGRHGDWMQTYSGVAFWPLDPKASEIRPVDIAHALAHLCRYGGHSRRFYSVAEHCVLMSHAVSPGNALWALLHDATEAYMGDVIRPLKSMLPDYRYYEGRLMDVICTRFGLPVGEPAEVKEADTRILLDERQTLMGTPPRDWGLNELTPLFVDIEGWPPIEAKAAYLSRLMDLLAEYRSGGAA